MSESKLVEQSTDFAIAIVEYYKWLTNYKKEFVMSKQILRSGTSIGANIYEAQYAVSKPDFISKMQIALKEASETEYWLIVLEKTGYSDAEFNSIKCKCVSIKKMLISTLNTSRKSI